VAAASVVGAIGGGALVDYSSPREHLAYYAAAVIIIGVGAGIFLDNERDNGLGRRALVSLIPCSMWLGWLGHCMLFSGGGCGLSGASLGTPQDIVRIAYLWVMLLLAVVIGSYAWPLLQWAFESLSNRTISDRVDRMTRLVTKIGGFVSAGAVLG
jgi:hypothetical protein